jgi:lysozyme
MKIPKQAVDLCKKWEGLYLKAYLCPANVPTVGYGATGKDIKLGMVVTEEWAEDRLEKELQHAMHWALKLSPNLINYENKLAAIISFIYNCGNGAYAASTLRRKVRAEEWQEAAEQLLKWNKAGGKVLRGLTLRRMDEAKLLLA